ncbi:MAG TPA: Rad52/Rad22 family DNA repair protein [Gemmata sp.]|nr:Rad52/Rad22 family DNA repair protein [Gemmata sp.]
MSANRQNTESVLARDPQVQALAAALSSPFEPREIKFKPQMVKNNRALAMAYIDARLIQDRLDEVLGVENWQDQYDILTDGSVMCRLRIRLGGRWITKSDVGSPSEQPDSGDRLKAAFSDALKRAAVKFGIGRYLYRLPAQWVDYDPVKKQLTQLPQLPAFALPTPKAPPAKATKPAQPPHTPAVEPAPAPKPTAADAAPAEHRTPAAAALPSNGEELHRRLQDYDAKLAQQKVCVRGALLAHVTQAGVKAGFTANLADWSGPAIPFAVDAVKQFEQTMRSANKSEPRTAA